MERNSPFSFATTGAQSSSTTVIHQQEHQSHAIAVVHSIFGVPWRLELYAGIHELIATFLVALIIYATYAAAIAPLLLAVAAAGLAYAWAVWFRGATCNPYIAFAQLLTCKISFWSFFCVFFAQFIGWMLGGLVIWAVVGNIAPAAPPAITAPEWEVFLLEMIAMMVVVMTYIHAGAGLFDGINPFVIGTAHVLAGWAIAPITGCILNPFRALAAQILAVSWAHCWVWYVGPLVGALLGVIFSYLFALHKAHIHDLNPPMYGKYRKYN